MRAKVVVCILLHLALLAFETTGGAKDQHSGGHVRSVRHTPFMPEDHWKGPPEFGDTETNVTVALNATAELKCPIAKVQDSAISFIRSRDFHILSNGHTLFTSDSRIEIEHLAKTIDWILRIRRVTHEDAGRYECQVSIKSGLYSLPFQLNVVTPRAEILGRSEFHLDRGSTISLTCVVQMEHAGSVQYVYWYHNSVLISYGSKTSIETRLKANSDEGATESTLTIQSASPAHSGNYSCQPSNAIPATIQVFVSDDRLSEPLLRPDAKDSRSAKTGTSSSSSSAASSSSSSFARMDSYPAQPLQTILVLCILEPSVISYLIRSIF